MRDAVNEILEDKTVLVSGGTGSIGSEIVLQALDQQARNVVVFSRDETKHFMMRRRLSDDRAVFFVGDLRDPDSIERVLVEFDVDIVYHAAAMKHLGMCEDFPDEASKTNILGTQNIVNSALRTGVSKLMTISTDKAVYPINVLGATKLIAERITLNANQRSNENQAFSCVRIGNVASSRGSVIPIFIDTLLNEKPIQVTNPDVTRFIVEIPDTVRLILRSTEYARGGEVFVLKAKAFKLGDLVDVITDRIAPKLGIEEESVDVRSIGLVQGEKLHEDLLGFSETSRLYELDDMFVLRHDGIGAGEYPSARKVSLSGYSSKDIDLLSKDRLEAIVLRYLNNRRAGNVDY